VYNIVIVYCCLGDNKRNDYKASREAWGIIHRHASLQMALNTHFLRIISVNMFLFFAPTSSISRMFVFNFFALNPVTRSFL